MPVYEFVCSECEKNFEELVRMGSSTENIHCPICGSQKVRKKLSRFAAQTSGGSLSSSASSSAACAPSG